MATALTLRAARSPTGGYAIDSGDPSLAEQLYPVLVLVLRADPGSATAFLVGQHVMTEGDAAMLKAGVDLWAQIPTLREAVRITWEGWTPPATTLPLGKIGAVLKLFGIHVDRPAAPAVGPGVS